MKKLTQLKKKGKVAELNKDEAELFEQYKEFYTIQGRTKEKCQVSGIFTGLK